MRVLFAVSHFKLLKDSKECDFVGMLYEACPESKDTKVLKHVQHF